MRQRPRGRGGRRARPRVEQAQLSEHLTGAEDGEERLAPVIRGSPQLDLALKDDVEPIAGLALLENDLALGDGSLGQGRTQGCRTLGIKREEERGLHQGVVHGLILSYFVNMRATDIG